MGFMLIINMHNQRIAYIIYRVYKTHAEIGKFIELFNKKAR
jgi:hypothetical protein